MALPDLPDGPFGTPSVPVSLFGCWRRNWIQFEGRERSSEVTVIWLQTASGMGDLRLDPAQTPAESDSSCGITIVDDTIEPITADWQDGETGFGQQTQSNFPEKGWLDWETPDLLYERAPSGAYVEEWERLPGSAGAVAHLVSTDTPLANLYLAGSHAFLAVHDPDGTGIHEYTYGTIDDGQTISVYSTFPDRVGKPLRLDRPWQLVSASTV